MTDTSETNGASIFQQRLAAAAAAQAEHEIHQARPNATAAELIANSEAHEEIASRNPNSPAGFLARSRQIASMRLAADRHADKDGKYR